MNRIDKFPFAIVVLVFIASLLAIRCKDDSSESASDKTKSLLQAITWKLDRLTVDNIDQASLYTDLTLTIANGTYTSQNGEPVVWFRNLEPHRSDAHHARQQYRNQN